MSDFLNKLKMMMSYVTQQQIYYPNSIYQHYLDLIMSFRTDKAKLLEDNQQQQFQESSISGYEEAADIPPTELSGDQYGQQSVFSLVDSKNKSNFFLTVITIIKTIIGSGILGLPFTVSKCGYVFSIIVFVVAAFLNQFSASLLLRSKNLSGHSNFSTIMYHIYQNKFSKAIGSILIFLNNMGVCIIEIIIFKTTIRKILEDFLHQNLVLNQFYTSKIFIAIIIGCCQIPSIIVKKIERLKFMAFIGVAGIFIFIGSFVVHYFISFQSYESNSSSKFSMDLFPADWIQAFASIPTLILALAYHMNFFPVFKGMRSANDKRMNLASLVAILVCSASYLLVGIMGYHLVHTINSSKQPLPLQPLQVKANFLQSLPYSEIQRPIFLAINCGFLLSVFFAFPIVFFSCRNNFIALVQLFFTKSAEAGSKRWRTQNITVQMISQYIQNQEKGEKRKRESRLFYICTFGIFLVILGIGIGLDDIEVVFNFIGAICSTSIGILLPCFFYFTLVIKKQKEKKYTFYLSLVIFGIMAPFAIFALVAQYTKN